MKIEDHLQAIRKASRPIEGLSFMNLAKVIEVMLDADGVVIVNGVPDGNVAIVQAETSNRKMVVFGSERDMRAFAIRYGLTVQPVVRGET